MHTFLYPKLCVELMLLGLTNKTLAHWRWQTDSRSAYLFSRHLDYLGMYEREMLPDSLQSNYTEVPAYSISELIAIIPGVMISEENGTWMVTGSSNLVETPCKARSLGEAVAMQVKQLLTSGKIIPKVANKQLERNISFEQY